MVKHFIRIEDRIKKRIDNGLNYIETLRSLYGADPREVWEIFRKYKKETVNKIGIKNTYPSLPEPHPAYSQWRLTRDSAKAILEKIVRMRYKKVCFLGCPILGSEYPGKTILFDIDKAVLDSLKKDSLIYDVKEEPSSELKNSFECVVIDPPWYNEDIKLFMKRAFQLTKIDGTIYTSLPGVLTKPSIPDERLELQRWLSRNDFIITEMMPIAEYQVPPFEYNAYLDIPAFTGGPWRIGDWTKLKKLGEIDYKFITYQEQTKWIEYSFAKKRIFLKKNEEDRTNAKLSTLYKDCSLIMKTVSKRSPLIPKIDIWSSRNAVLHIDSGYSEVKKMLDKGSYKDNSLLKKLIEI